MSHDRESWKGGGIMAFVYISTSRNKDAWPEVERRGRTEFETKGKGLGNSQEVIREGSWSDQGGEEPTPAQHEFVEN